MAFTLAGVPDFFSELLDVIRRFPSRQSGGRKAMETIPPP
jgi:hypothetical protein